MYHGRGYFAILLHFTPQAIRVNLGTILDLCACWPCSASWCNGAPLAQWESLCPGNGSQSLWGSIVPEIRPRQSLGTPSGNEGVSLALCPHPPSWNVWVSPATCRSLWPVGNPSGLLDTPPTWSLQPDGVPLVLWMPHIATQGPYHLLGALSPYPLLSVTMFFRNESSQGPDRGPFKVQGPMQCAYAQNCPHLGALLFTYMCSQLVYKKIYILIKKSFISLILTNLSV